MTPDQNIRSVLAKADKVDFEEGLLAYQNYHVLLKRLADYYSISFETTVAVFAATSPNNDYIKNLRSTATLLKGFQNGYRVEDLTTTSYNACKLRAWRVLNGEHFLSFTKGPK